MLSLIPLFKFEAAADTQRDVYPIDTYAKLQSIASVDSTWTELLIFTLQKDMSGSESIVFSDSDQSKNIYIDLNGHKLSFTDGNDSFSDQSFFIIGKNISLTVLDNLGGGMVISNSKVCIYVGQGGSFTLESGTIECSNNICINSMGATINIKGGIVKNTNTEDSTINAVQTNVYMTGGHVIGKINLFYNSVLYADGGTVDNLTFTRFPKSFVTQTKPDSGMTIIDYTSESVHYVTFDSAGGDYTPQKQIRANMPATEPTRKPVRDDGYVFAGWTYNGDDWDFTQDVTEDITLVAKYVPSISNITANVADGDVGNVQYGDTVKLEITDVTAADGLDKSDVTYTWYRYEYDTSTKDFTKRKYLATGNALEYTVAELGTYIIRCEMLLNNYWLAKPFHFEGIKRTLTKDDFNYTAPNDLFYDGTKKEATVTGKLSGMPDVTIKYYNSSDVENVPLKKGTYTVKASTVETVLCNAASGIEIGKFTIAEIEPKITVTGNVLTVTVVENLGGGKPVVLALYNGNRLVDIKIKAYDGNPLEFSLNSSIAYSSAKVMILDSLKTIMPLCAAEIISF